MARRRIKVSSFRGEDIEVEFPDGTVYPIRGDLPMDLVVLLSELDEEGQEADESGEKEDFDAWFARAKGLIMDLIREKTPDAPEMNLSPQEVLGLAGAIVGGESVGQAIADALNAGLAEAVDKLDGEEENGAGPLVETPKPKAKRRAPAKT